MIFNISNDYDKIVLKKWDIAYTFLIISLPNDEIVDLYPRQ